MAQSTKVQVGNFLTLAAIILIVFWLWQPFDLRHTGWYEEWVLYWVYYSAPIAAGLVGASRYLSPLSFILSYLLVDTSFVGMNLVLAGIFIFKAVLTYTNLRLLLGMRAFAFATAVLLMIYPLDIGTSSTSPMFHQMSLVCYLMAAFFMLRASVTHRRRDRAAMSLFLIMSLLQSEAVLPLLLITPLAFWWKLRRDADQAKRLTVGWYRATAISVGLFLLTALPLMLLQAGYQTRLLISADELDFANVVGPYLLMFGRGFALSWLEALKTFQTSAHFRLPALVIAGITMIVSWLHLRWQTEPAPRWHRYALLIASGAIMACLGFLPFAVTSLRFSMHRVFYFASLGMAITLAALVFLLATRMRYQRLAATLSIGVLTFFAALYSLGCAQLFVQIGEYQQSLIAQVIRQAPQLSEPVTILFTKDPAVDMSSVQQRFYAPRGLGAALNLIYGDVPGKVTQLIECSPQFGAQVTCDFRDDGVYIEAQNAAPILVPYNTLLLFQFSPSGELVLLREFPVSQGQYQPDSFIVESELPSRAPLFLPAVMGQP